MDQNERQPDRRRKRRYPIQQALSCKVLERQTVVAEGPGATLDISSNGVSFRSAELRELLTTGAIVELSVSLPTMPEGGTSLQLVMLGRVIRNADDWAACTIYRHEFRAHARVRETSAAVHPSSGAGPLEAIPRRNVVPLFQRWNRKAARA